MKKIILSAVTAVTLGSVAIHASDIKLYQDANGQVFTSAADGRTLIEDKSTSVFAHADKLKFSGQTFIGYKNTDFKDNTANPDTQTFEVRRGYLQLKAYLLDDPKSYYRVTLDLKQDSDIDGGSLVVRAKYAYLYLNEILPATGLEIGLAHRPWHDYEEHNSWYYRSISEVLIENKNSAHLANSADFGVMAKTVTKYVDADIGVFNGEGYHNPQISDGMSLEWRFTGHLLGVNGKDNQTKSTYFDASFFGQLNSKHYAVSATQTDDLNFYGLHTVFNMPMFLASAQYVLSDDTSDVSTRVSAGAGNGYSVNGEFRFGSAYQYKLLGKYDSWTPKALSGTPEYERKTIIAGAAWKQNKNVEWVANVTVNSDKDDYYKTSAATANGTAYMLTAEVGF